jgi:hypothetical protein
LIIPTGTLGYDYIDKILEVSVVHECSGNSCWGYAKIEDKSIPELICPVDVTIDCSELNDLNITGYPVFPVGTIITPLEDGSFLLENFDKCSDVILEYRDVVVNDLCTGPFSTVITRTWYVTDDYSNTSSCTHSIYVERATLEDIVMPGSWDNVLGPNPSLEACEDWPKLPAGHEFEGNPDPIFTGMPSGILCLKAAVIFTDIKFQSAERMLTKSDEDGM